MKREMMVMELVARILIFISNIMGCNLNIIRSEIIRHPHNLNATLSKVKRPLARGATFNSSE